MKQKITQFTTYHLVKSEDLNHHGTLFAGRGAEWFVESGFIAAANLVNPKNLICGDSDTIAAMCGGISAAFYKEIPQSIIDFTLNKLPKEFIDIINDFDKKYSNF